MVFFLVVILGVVTVQFPENCSTRHHTKAGCCLLRREKMAKRYVGGNTLLVFAYRLSGWVWDFFLFFEGTE